VEASKRPKARNRGRKTLGIVLSSEKGIMGKPSKGAGGPDIAVSSRKALTLSTHGFSAFQEFAIVV
jgi:hypothetical protein